MQVIFPLIGGLTTLYTKHKCSFIIICIIDFLLKEQGFIVSKSGRLGIFFCTCICKPRDTWESDCALGKTRQNSPWLMRRVLASVIETLVEFYVIKLDFLYTVL